VSEFPVPPEGDEPCAVQTIFIDRKKAIEYFHDTSHRVGVDLRGMNVVRWRFDDDKKLRYLTIYHS
jgi:hypothetical protein